MSTTFIALNIKMTVLILLRKTQSNQIRKIIFRKSHTQTQNTLLAGTALTCCGEHRLSGGRCMRITCLRCKIKALHMVKLLNPVLIAFSLLILPLFSSASSKFYLLFQKLD